MIIVNQDKKMIVNFENITGVVLKEHIANMDGEKETMIEAIDVLLNEIVLGYYATEERAKEVLREIIEKIKNKSTVEMDAIGVKTEISDGIYEMPQE